MFITLKLLLALAAPASGARVRVRGVNDLNQTANGTASLPDQDDADDAAQQVSDASPLWQCTTSYYLDDAEGSLKNMSIKGMAMDDTTMSECSDKITGVWPHTKNEPVKALRLFSAWKTEWNKHQREASWDSLLKFVNATGAKIFMGVDAHDNMHDNEQQWKWALELMKRLGKDNIIGMSFGNEMINKRYKSSFWKAFYHWVVDKVHEMDGAGLDVPITVVYSMAVLPQLEKKSNKFVNQMYEKYGERWTFSVNPYALWDMSLRPKGRSDCVAMSKAAVSIDYVKGVMGAFRKAVNDYTGKTDAPVWIGETGWSSPFSASMKGMAKTCPQFCSDWSLKTYYQNILAWDGSLKDGLTPPQYIFYFTNRDSFDHGDRQPFGLIKSCGDDTCKLQDEPHPPASE